MGFMPNANAHVSLEMFVATLEMVRGMQERLNEMTLMSFALLDALVEKDTTFADLYISHKEKIEAGEAGQKMASNLEALNSLLDKMNADLG